MKEKLNKNIKISYTNKTSTKLWVKRGSFYFFIVMHKKPDNYWSIWNELNTLKYYILIKKNEKKYILLQ